MGLPWAVMYCATKWAVQCYTDSLRRELMRSGVQVLKMTPGIGERDYNLDANWRRGLSFARQGYLTLAVRRCAR